MTTVVGPDVRTVYLADELDLHSNAKATAAFTIAVGAGLPIVVDLTDLDFMDCGGYRAIADARQAAAQHGITLTITHAHGEPARLLSLLGEQRRETAAALLPQWVVLMSGVAVITEACIGTKDRACVDVCPVQCIYEFDPANDVLVSEVEAGDGQIVNRHTTNADAIAIFGDSLLYVNLDECTSCTACYEPDVCPVGAIYADDQVPDGTTAGKYNADDPHSGHDHTFFIEHSRNVFAD